MIDIDRVNQYRFLKLNVNSGKEWNIEDVDILIRSVLALHAARIGKPYISLVNKGITDSVQKIYEHINFSNKFAYVRCMRKTLHLCVIDDLEMLHFSTRNIRISKKFEMSERSLIKRSEAFIEDALGDKTIVPAEIYSYLMNKFNLDIASARTLVKYHWENGLLCLNNESDIFYKEQRTFQLTNVKYGISLNTRYDEQFYINELIKKYIFCYGPVSFEDIVWWTGLSKIKVRIALKSLKKQIVEFNIKGLSFSLFICVDHWYELNNLAVSDNWCKFMAFEDCVMKGYMQTRFFYGDNFREFFNSIGEIFPTIVYNGKCIGQWNIDLEKKIITFKVSDGISINKQLLERELLGTKIKIFGGE